MDLIKISKEVRRRLEPLEFGPPVAFVYNPLDYAWDPYQKYLEAYAGDSVETLLVGMNPGPFGMAQTGVPFGEVNLVQGWLGITGQVGHPPEEHPKRPIKGFACQRSEVSGARLWGWAKRRFGTAERFFERFFVGNYCPLVFIEESGRNRTPNKLKAQEKRLLFEVCDWALAATVETLQPKHVLGIGAFVEKRCQAVLDGWGGVVGRILHPSPASPKANCGWATQAEDELAELGIAIP